MPILYDQRGREVQLRDVSALEETVAYQADNLEVLKERLAELELALEDQGWRQLVVGGQREFSRSGLAEIQRLARLMYLKNPLIRRGVDTQALYVWGRGVTIQARDPRVNAVVQDFLDDPKNQVEFTSHEARRLKEVTLQVLGNVFFVLFTDPSTGQVRTRSIPPDEVRQIVCNPDDAKEPWFYLREWVEMTFDERGQEQQQSRKAYYPDWQYCPQQQPETMYGSSVKWDQPVCHVKVGALDDMKLGVPEVYPALDWAKAYKEFLEDWCTITRAYARFAWDMKTIGGQRGVSAAKSKLGTTLASGANETTIETNPAPVVGSTFIRSQNVELKPFKTAGATTSADDGRRVLLMVAAAIGLPETFFGDANVGNHATSKTLDRPTELKFRDRQTLWAEIYRRILDYVIDQAAAAPNGPLKGLRLVKRPADPDEVRPIRSDPKAGEEVDRYVAVGFPTVLEHDVAAQVTAIVSAATLNGYELAGTIDLKTVSRLLLQELGAEDIDEILDMLFPEGQPIPTGRPLDDEQRLARRPAPPRIPGPDQPDPNETPHPSLDDDLARSATSTEAAHFTTGVRELRDSLMKFTEKYAGRRLAA